MMMPARRQLPRDGILVARVPDPAERALADARRKPSEADVVPDAVATREPSERSAVPAPAAAPASPYPEDASEDAPAARADGDDVAPETGTAGDLDGWWLVTNSVDATDYPAFAGLRLGYRVYLWREAGDRVVGRGVKWTENGRPVPPRRRTPIFVSGVIRDGRLQVRFVEHGTARVSEGRFEWRLSPDAARLHGRFASDAANSSGRSDAHRVL